MDLTLVGIDHHVAPLEVRECLALPKDGVGAIVRRICDLAWAEEALLIATCNRTELYVATSDPDGGNLAVEALVGALPGAEGLDRCMFRVREGETAARHLFRVTAGLESAILGETEIQGQVRHAHEIALTAGTAGKILDRLTRGALRAGKRARTETRVSSGGVSHGSAAARVAQRIFGGIKGREVLLIGAGDMARQTAMALAAQGQGRYVVANRTRERAEELAAALPEAEVVGVDAIPERITKAHVVVVAGGALPLDKAMIARTLPKRREPLLIVDLCVPRLAEEAIRTLPGVFLYHLDALEELVAGSLAERHEAVPEVETILAQEFSDFRGWYRALGALPAIKSMQAWAEAVRQRELGYLPDDVNGEIREAVEKLTQRLVKKLLARPASRVVRGMEKEDPDMPTADHLRAVFGLEEQEKESS